MPPADPVAPVTVAPRTASACPRCSGPNGCAVSAAGRFDIDCWCRHATFDVTAQAYAPMAGRDLACMCPRCAAGTGVAAAGATPP